MPNVKDMIRNHFIDSEEDIPEEKEVRLMKNDKVFGGMLWEKNIM